jgi:hypothetical protein
LLLPSSQTARIATFADVVFPGVLKRRFFMVGGKGGRRTDR